MIEVCTASIGGGSDAVYWAASEPTETHVAIEHDNKQTWYATVYPTKAAFLARKDPAAYKPFGVRSKAVTWACHELGQDALYVFYTLSTVTAPLCGVPMCGREATQVVQFFSDTPMLIRGMEATGQEGQHEYFCDQCYHQAGFNSESDITAIPVHDIEIDYGCNCDDCMVPYCTGQCWADEVGQA